MQRLGLRFHMKTPFLSPKAENSQRLLNSCPIKFVPEQFYLFNIFDVFLLTKIKHQIDLYVHVKLHKVVPPTPKFFS